MRSDGDGGGGSLISPSVSVSLSWSHIRIPVIFPGEAGDHHRMGPPEGKRNSRRLYDLCPLSRFRSRPRSRGRLIRQHRIRRIRVLALTNAATGF